MVMILHMSDDKPKPIDDLKEGLGLLFRAAKGAVDKLPTGKIEEVAQDAAKEVTRAFESLGSELEKAFGTTPAAKKSDAPPPAPPKDEKKYDDGYAANPDDETPRGPRVG